MPSFFDKLLHHGSHKQKHSEQSQQEQEPQSQPQGQPQSEEGTVSIQPHPATTNDPRDLEPPQPGGGLNCVPEQQAFNTPGPYIPSPEVRDRIEQQQPKSREELQARSAELNK